MPLREAIKLMEALLVLLSDGVMRVTMTVMTNMMIV
jgi:hypothetical protein